MDGMMEVPQKAHRILVISLMISIVRLGLLVRCDGASADLVVVIATIASLRQTTHNEEEATMRMINPPPRSRIRFPGKATTLMTYSN
jgi:hypothetical protein